MSNKWIVVDHHIAIDTGDEILHPSADEVYSFLAEDYESLTIPNPLEQLNRLHFSKVGSPIKCKVFSNADDEIALSIYAVRKNKEYAVDMIEGQIIDHALSDSEWFYITGDLDTLQQMFAVAGIKHCGSLSIGQYLDLIKQEFFSDNKEIINCVNKDTIHKLLASDGRIPEGIKAELYNYQKTGFLWMKTMLDANHGCILGDEMGLGKTLQVITIFQSLKLQKRLPLLVVAPVSLLENWKRECEKFAPDLDVYIHHGSKRTGLPSVLKNHDVVIISYNTAVSDLSMLKMINWWCVVLDEAQNIKNPYSDRAKSVKSITRKTGIAVTGTPFENHITDVWSLVDFSVPGLLGELSSFQHSVSDDVLGAEKIEPILSPIMIRRLVRDVANDLPEKIVIPQPLVMSEEEQQEYIRYQQEAKTSASNGSALTLAILQKMRMFCTHQLLCEELSGADPWKMSIKYQRLCEIIEEIISRGEKLLVFTSYKKMFDIFESDIPHRFEIEMNSINGDTPVAERQTIVDWFNNYDGSAMLALNPRAAGTGLNITGANHVVHYNLEWNPSLEDQASARSYRRGQDKNVFIYRLYYTDTVEEIVNERIDRKRDIASTAIVGTDGAMEKNDILRALELAPELH